MIRAWLSARGGLVPSRHEAGADVGLATEGCPRALSMGPL